MIRANSLFHIHFRLLANITDLLSFSGSESPEGAQELVTTPIINESLTAHYTVINVKNLSYLTQTPQKSQIICYASYRNILFSVSICELCDYYRVKQKSGKSASVALKTSLGPNGIFCAFAQFSAGIGPAHFLADLRNAALSAFEEGAPFMGTALAAYKQCIGAEVVCIFT